MVYFVRTLLKLDPHTNFVLYLLFHIVLYLLIQKLFVSIVQ